MTAMNRHESRYEELARRLRESVLQSRGDTDSALRRAVEARTAALGGRAEAPASELPPELAAYVDKIGLHAYKITEEDLAALKRAGYSEDAIFEISVAAAVGAGMSRLERGLAALNLARKGETR